MKKLTYSEFKKAMQDWNDTHKDYYVNTLTGVIVITEDSFTEQYPLAERSYAVSSNNKAFISSMGGYSIYGSALEGTDQGVRLEGYLANEHGGENGWKVEYCYLKEGKTNDQVL